MIKANMYKVASICNNPCKRALGLGLKYKTPIICHQRTFCTTSQPEQTLGGNRATPPYFDGEVESLTPEQQKEKEELIKELTKRLSGPLADEHGNVPTGKDRPIAIEVDGPTHYYANSTRVTAYTKLKHRLLTRMGYKVLHVPYFEWRKLRGAKEREEYMREKLKEEPTEWMDPEDEKFYAQRMQAAVEAAKEYAASSQVKHAAPSFTPAPKEASTHGFAPPPPQQTVNTPPAGFAPPPPQQTVNTPPAGFAPPPPQQTVNTPPAGFAPPPPQQTVNTPPAGFAPPPPQQSVNRPPAGFAPPPPQQTVNTPPSGFAPPPPQQTVNKPPAGFAPPPPQQTVNTPPAGFAPPPPRQTVNTPPAGFAPPPPQQTVNKPPAGFAPPPPQQTVNTPPVGFAPPPPQQSVNRPPAGFAPPPPQQTPPVGREIGYAPSEGLEPPTSTQRPLRSQAPPPRSSPPETAPPPRPNFKK